jgi:hypothetical protein
MCGYEFKKNSEKNNPYPYPPKLYLNNKSSRCCPKCNGIVVAMRSSDKLNHYIKSFAINNELKDYQKKIFCAECYNQFGERLYLEEKNAFESYKLMKMQKS